jgi:hypothetical protein
MQINCCNIGLYYLTQSQSYMRNCANNVTEQNRHITLATDEHSRNYEQFINLGHTDYLSSIKAQCIIARHHIHKTMQ